MPEAADSRSRGIVRVLMVAVALAGPGVFAYPILWILMPQED